MSTPGKVVLSEQPEGAGAPEDQVEREIADCIEAATDVGMDRARYMAFTIVEVMRRQRLNERERP